MCDLWSEKAAVTETDEKPHLSGGYILVRSKE